MEYSMQRNASGMAAALCFFFASSAIAAEDVQQGVPKPRPFVPLDRSIFVVVGVSSTYDSNVATSSKARAAASGIEQKDVIVAPKLDVDMTLPFGRNIFKLNGTGSYNFYFRNTQRDGELIALRGSLSSDFRICQTELNGRINRNRSNIGDFNTVAASRNIFTNFETTTEASGTLSCGPEVGFRPFASAVYTRGRNSAQEREVSDFNTFSYGVGMAYARPSLGELGIVGSVEKTDFPERIDGSLASGQPGFSTRSAGAYFNREIARSLQARLQLNYTEVDPKIGSKGFSGLTGNLLVRLVPGGQVKIIADLTRSVKPSLAFNVDYIVENAANVSVLVPLSPKLEMHGAFDCRGRKYSGKVNSDLNPLLKDSLCRIDGDLSYKLGRRINLGLNLAYQWRSADNNFYDFDGWRIGTKLGITF